MHIQATITIACKSGQVYQTNAFRENKLPFLLLCTWKKVSGIEKRDEPEFRLGMCVAEFALTAERMFLNASESVPHATQAPMRPPPVQDDEIEKFTSSIVSDLIIWAGIDDMRIKARVALAQAGYLTEAEIETLATRYLSHIKEYFRNTGHETIEICSDTIPERDLRLYSNYEESNYMCDGINRPLLKNYEAYALLRQQGVTQERLLVAMTAEAEYFMNHGFLQKY